MKISDGLLLCSVLSSAGAALGGEMSWAAGRGAVGAWARPVPAGEGAARVSPPAQQVPADGSDASGG